MINFSAFYATMAYFAISVGVCLVGFSEAIAFIVGSLIAFVLGALLICLLGKIEDLLYTIATWRRNRKDDKKNKRKEKEGN